MNKYILILILALSSGCSTTHSICQTWQSSGQVIGSIDSCEQCVKTLGKEPRAVSGCMVGLDAARLLK